LRTSFLSSLNVTAARSQPSPPALPAQVEATSHTVSEPLKNPLSKFFDPFLHLIRLGPLRHQIEVNFQVVAPPKLERPSGKLAKRRQQSVDATQTPTKAIPVPQSTKGRTPSVVDVSRSAPVSTYRSFFPSLTTHGQRRPSNVLPSLPRQHRPSCRSPSLSSPHTDVTPLLVCSGLMVFGCRLDCYSLLSIVSVVFIGLPRSRFSRTGHPLTLFTLILPMRIPPTWPLCGALLARIPLSVISSQSLSHTALFLYCATLLSYLYCATLLSYLVFSFAWFSPMWGSRTRVSKGVDGKSRRRYIRTNILHPHHSHPHPHSTPPTSAYSPLRCLAHQSSSTRLWIAYLYRCL